MHVPPPLQNEKTILIAMWEAGTVEYVQKGISSALEEGADALGLELNRMPFECLNHDDLSRIFTCCKGKPIYVTCYRKGSTEKLDDTQRESMLSMAVHAGATLVDVIGGFYDSISQEFSDDRDVVEKQKALISRLHDYGAQVLVSSHFYQFLPKARILEIAQAQIDRGTDIVKIISWSGTQEEMYANFETTIALKSLGKPFLFATNGPWCKMHRYLAPFFEASLVLCTQRYASGLSRVQPLLKTERMLVDSINANPDVCLDGIIETYKY